MQIAHISVYPEEGASHSKEGDISALAGYLHSLLSAFPEEEEIRHVVLTNLKGKSPKTFRDGSIVVEEIWNRGALSFAWTIFRAVLKKKECRVVHLQHEFNQFGKVASLPLLLLLLAAIRWIAGRKLAVTVHEVLSRDLITREFLNSVFIKYPPWLTRACLTIYYHLLGLVAHVLLVQDDFFLEILRDQYRVKSRLEVLKIGTCPASATPRSEARALWKLPVQNRVVLFFGTLDWRKGLDVLMDAWSLLPPDFGTLVVSGGTPTRAGALPEYQAWRRRVEDKARSLPGIILTGFVDDPSLPSLFGAADLVVLPYLVPQRVSAVFNHAASFGIPLIASEAFAGQAEPEMLFKAEPSALADKFQSVFSGGLEDLRLASIRFRDNNTWTKSSQKLARIYRSLSQQRP